MSKAIIAAAAAAISLLAAPAFARDYAFVVSKSELSSSAGLERVMKRIERTARGVCNADMRAGLTERRNALACASEVAEEIVAAIDHAPLTAAWRQDARFASR